MKIAFGTDTHNALTEALERHLREKGHEVLLVAEGANWVHVGHEAALAVVEKRAQFGIVCCTTGTGVAMAANKIRGVRAALCKDAYSARGARRYNAANVLALSLFDAKVQNAIEIVDAFLGATVDASEVSTIDTLEAH
jgi:ribose 5-phosphate isomerase B